MAESSPAVQWSLLVAAVGLLALALLVVGPATAAPDDGDGNVTLYRVSNASLDSADAVEAAIDHSRDPADGMVAGETLVVALDSSRVTEAIADGNGTETERFLDAIEGNVTFRIDQTNPTTMRPRKVARLGPENVTVHRSGSTVYVLLDTGTLEYHFRGDADDFEPWRDGNRFAVTFGYDAELDWPSGPTYALYGVEAEFFDQRRHEPLPPEVVNRTVKVNIEPLDAAVVRITLGDDETRMATVGPVEWTGFQGVSFDLRGVEPGTSYTLELVHDGDVVDRANGTVREPRARLSDATLTEVETDLIVTRDGERVTETITDHVAVELTARLTHGGQLVVLDASCEAVGHAWVDPANVTRVTVPLWADAEPVRNRSLSEYAVEVRADRYDRASADHYRGAHATASVNGGVQGCGPSTPATRTGGPASSDDPTEVIVDTGVTATPSPPAVTSDSTASPGQPGFTGVLTVLSLIGIVLVRQRRR